VALWLGVVALTVATDTAGWTLPSPGWLLVLPAAFAAAQLLVVQMRVGRSALEISFSEVPLLVGLVVASPLALLASRTIGTTYALAAHSGLPPRRLLGELGRAWFETCSAILLWQLLLGTGDPLGPRGWAAAIVTLAATHALTNAAFPRASAIEAPRRDLRRLLLAGVLAAAANASFGIVVVLVLSVDWRAGWSLLAVSATLVLAYRAYGNLHHKHDAIERLYAFTCTIEGRLEPRSLATTLLAEAATLLHGEVAELVLLDEDGEVEETLVRRRGRVTTTPGGRSLLEPIVGSSQLTGSLLLPRVGRRSLPSLGGMAPVRDVVAVPLRSDAGTVGTLAVADRAVDVSTFTEEDRRLLETLATQAAIALQNCRLVEQLREQAAVNAYQATHDELTGLVNRAVFHDKVVEAIATDGCAAVFLMDLDRFKEINDTLGHSAGDQLLQQVASRLVRTTGDSATVARLGGDEFAIVVPAIEDEDRARFVGRQIEVAFELPITIGQAELEVHSSIGLALAPEHAEDAETLLQRADVAMYAAKEAGGGVSVYHHAIDHHSRRRLTILHELRPAIENRQLSVHYQPKIDLASGELRGFEALVRWHHPDHGQIYPDEFIPLVEQAGLTGPLTEFVLRSALEQCREWRLEGLAVNVAVNIAARNLLDTYLPTRVYELLRATRMPAQSLTLEITETGTVLESDRTREILDRLSGLGVKLSVDDFGTGHSSLSRLRDLPVDEIKIDRTFVSNMTVDPSDRAIVRSTIDLGRHLALDVVAEGIEDAETAWQLWRLGCGIGQGYHFGRPLSVDELRLWLEEMDPRAMASAPRDRRDHEAGDRRDDDRGDRRSETTRDGAADREEDATPEVAADVAEVAADVAEVAAGVAAASERLSALPRPRASTRATSIPSLSLPPGHRGPNREHPRP
jgi:diguanylate cyclase (GGDEF)-like protein